MAVWVERNNILYPALYLSPHSVQFLVFSFFLTVMQISGASALALAYATSVCGIYMHVLSCCFRLNMNEGQIQLLGSQRKHSVSAESTWFFLHLILSFISWVFLDIFIKRCTNLKRTYGHLFQVFQVTLLSQTKFPLEMIKTFHAARIEHHIQPRNSFPASGPNFNSSIRLKATKFEEINCLMGQLFDALWQCWRLRAERWLDSTWRNAKATLTLNPIQPRKRLDWWTLQNSAMN